MRRKKLSELEIKDVEQEKIVKVDDTKLVPIGVKKFKDKFGFHKVYIYNGLEALEHIMRFRIKQQQKHQDTTYLVSGLEGSGKSGFTLWAADIYVEESGNPIDISHITRNLKELFGKVYKLREQPSFLSLDEGAELDGSNAMSKGVRKTKEKFTIMRKCSHIIMVCFVNPLRITTYFREDRIRGLFFVVKHGEVWFYSNNQDNPHLVTIIDSWRKDHDAKSLKFLKRYAPDMILKNIPEYHGWLRKEYESRKDSNIFAKLKEDEEEEEVDDGETYLDPEQAARYTHRSNVTIKNLARRGQLPFIRVGRMMRFKKSDLDIWIKDGIKSFDNME